MTLRVTPGNLYKIRKTLSTLFELPHAEGGYHVAVGETLPRWAADHLAATGGIPEEFRKSLMEQSDRSECFFVKNKEDGPGLLIVFYRPADGFLH